jgi:hypothetical protein
MSEDIELSDEQRSLLDAIRKEDKPDGNVGRSGHTSTSVNKIQRTFGNTERSNSGSPGMSRSPETGETRPDGRPEADETTLGTIQRSSEGSRPSISQSFNSPESNRTTSERLQGDQTSVGNAQSNALQADEEERRKILARQRQERFRAKQNQAQNAGVTVTPPVTQNVTHESNAGNGIQFSLKKLLPGNAKADESNAKKDKPKEEIKLLTSKEADEYLEALTYIYKNGSGILDDIIQIVVKGHDEVTIWQLDEDEAEELARMHLSKAKVSKEAAASARKLIDLYSKTYFIMLLGPRAIATVRHVKEHGGLSFK